MVQNVPFNSKRINSKQRQKIRLESEHYALKVSLNGKEKRITHRKREQWQEESHQSSTTFVDKCSC